MIENVSLWVSESHQLSRTWQQNPSAAGSCVASYPRREADPSGFQMFPSWWSPPSRIQTTSCKHQILKRTSSEWVWLLNYTAKTVTEAQLQTNLSWDVLHCGFPGWWQMIVHQCQTSALLPWRGSVSTGTNGQTSPIFYPSKPEKQTNYYYYLKRGTPPVLHVSG